MAKRNPNPGSIYESHFPGVAQSKYVAPKPPLTGNPQTDAILQGGKIKPPPKQQPISVQAITSILDPLGYAIAGEPFSKTNAGKLAAGKITPKQFVTSPFEQHGQVNAGMPPFPLFKGGAAKIPHLSPEDAAKAVAVASQAAKSGGFVPRLARPEVPTVVKGATTPETAGATGAQVRKALQGGPAAGAKSVRAEQELGYSVERGKRAAAGSEVMQEKGGVAGYRAALGQLKGGLPKLNFQNFQNFSQDAVDEMFNHIQQHPQLRFYEKINAQDSILKALGGKVPTKSEQRLLETAFGRDVTKQIVESIPFWAKAKNLGLEVLNVPRAVMASFDMSAPFRQGLVVGVTRPGLFFRNFAPMVKSFGSEKVYQALMTDVHTRPTAPLMQKAGLALTDIGTIGKDVALTQREEQFMSNLAEHIPVVGHGIRASDRAYTGFLNKTRADYFDFLVHSAAQQGRDVTDEKLLQSIARFVNSATGRGDLGALKSHAVTLNTLMFSPRLLFSRLNFLNPVYYAKLDPFARQEALRAARNLVASMGAVLYLAKLGGAQVNTDPRNADFAKIKIGNTRLDIAGGFQQPVRLLAQLFSGKIVSSTSGKTLTLGPQGPGKLSRRDIVQRFFEGKLAPVPSLVNDLFKGTDFQGQPFSWKKAMYSRMVPLLAQDTADLYRQDGLLPAVGGYAIGGIGMGIQTYGPKKPKPSTSAPSSDAGSSYEQTAPGAGGSVYDR